MRIKQSCGSSLPQNVSGVTSVAPLCVSEAGERGRRCHNGGQSDEVAKEEGIE